MLDHNIDTEHLLLGLIRVDKGVAVKALEALEISLGAVRERVEVIIGRGQGLVADHIQFTPRAKKVLELSLRESIQLGHNYVGTEHILLGLVREGEGVAAQVLESLGADLNRVRQTVVQLLSGYAGVQEEPLGEPIEEEPRCPGCRAMLTATSAYAVHEVPAVEGEGSVRATFVFCRTCGRTLGVLPDGS